MLIARTIGLCKKSFLAAVTDDEKNSAVGISTRDRMKVQGKERLAD